MKKTAFGARFLSMLICIAIVMSMATVCTVASYADDSKLIAYVADENKNAYPEYYSKYVNDSKNMSKIWEGFAWRGDEVLSRIDILTLDVSYTSAKLVTDDFVSSDGSVIDAENISFTYLDAVKIDERAYSLFDVITKATVRDYAPEKMYSAWVSIKVPENTKAGIYTAKLSIVSGDKTLAEFEYTLTVYDLVQPELQSVVDLWMWPYNTVRYYSGKTTEELYGQETMNNIDWKVLYNTHLDKKYFPALESELELYAKAGGDTIFAQVNEENRTNGDPYPSLVKWNKNPDGSMSYDYTDFDAYVELNIKHGITKQIKCYAMGNFMNTIVYYDIAKDKVVTFTDRFGGKIWKQYWGAFLDDFILHLEKKGWFDITYMALDERDYNITKAVIDEVKLHTNKNGESLKIATAVATFECESLFDDIADLSLAYGMSGGHLVDIVNDRNEKGLITTLYTCGPQGSSMLNDAGASAESIHVTYKEGTTGFLRWALQKYNADPFATSLNYNKTLCAGDCYLIYPSYDNSMKAQSTPRYEKLCEGLRDIEKMRYIEASLTDIKNEVHNAMLETQYQNDFRNVINTYSEVLTTRDEPEFNFTEDKVFVLCGEETKLSLAEQAKAIVSEQAAEEYIDDANFTFSDGWTGEGQYFWLFLYSTNHYASKSADAQATLSYRFTFTGDSFVIKGSKGGDSGIANVFVDGVRVGQIDQYISGSELYSELYISDKLEYGDHVVEVVGAGAKNPSSYGYKLQVDYAIASTDAKVEWKSANENIATVSDDGTVTGVHAGQTLIYATCGDFTASALVSVSGDKAALGALVDDLKDLPLDGYDEALSGAFRDALNNASQDNSSASDNDIAQMYKALVSAHEALVEKISLISRPSTTAYNVGESLIYDGAEISVKYKNGTTKTLAPDKYTVNGYDPEKIGIQRLSVIYGGKSVSFSVAVIENVALTSRFKDVSSGAWYYKSIQYAVSNSLFNGMSETTFEPNTAMTRAMLVRVLYNLEGSPSVVAYDNIFDDVKEGIWYTDAIKWAAANGIVNGVSKKEFAPNLSITREQLSTILYRYAKDKGYDMSAASELSSFPDGDKASGYAKDALSWAVASGLISGNKIGGVDMLDPRGAATRAQVAAILMRYAII